MKVGIIGASGMAGSAISKLASEDTNLKLPNWIGFLMRNIDSIPVTASFQKGRSDIKNSACK